MDVAIAVLVTLGPIAALLAAALTLLQRHNRRRLAPPMQWPGAGGGPYRAGDRSPTRPRVPSMSGGAALPIPEDVR